MREAESNLEPGTLNLERIENHFEGCDAGFDNRCGFDWHSYGAGID
jgi:hypothetical protein